MEFIKTTLAIIQFVYNLILKKLNLLLINFSSLSRSLIAACNENDVNAVRRLLGEGNNTIHEATDDGDSLLSLACSAGYYELAQVRVIVI